MGLASLGGNQLFERVRLWVTDPKLCPPAHYIKKVPTRAITAFTVIQLLALGALWLLKSSKLGILFPLLIALLVPLRWFIARFFSPEHLAALDAEHETEEEEPQDVGIGG
jgi:hypothetical protein